MQVLTTSRQTVFRRCQQEHEFSYELGRRPRVTAHALGFGSLWHAGLEAWWRFYQRHAADERVVTAVDEWGDERVVGGHTAAPAADGALESAISATRDAFHAQDAGDTELNVFDLVRAEELLAAYHFCWRDRMADMEVLGVEVEFETPLVNPDSGRPSRNWVLGGKIDAIVRFRSTGEVWIVEHKTTSSDVSPESNYWLRLRIDGQVSTYYEGATALGYDVRGCMYDVVQKPSRPPLKATPLEKRKYTTRATRLKDGTQRPAGSLHAGMRDADETPEEYRIRLREIIIENPSRYLQRGSVVRLEDDLRRYRLDAWRTAKLVRDVQLNGSPTRNPDSCVRYGRLCSYFDVCTGAASIDDDERFRSTESAHEELSQEVKSGD